jgi:hypothetical protein
VIILGVTLGLIKGLLCRLLTNFLNLRIPSEYLGVTCRVT